MTAPADANSPWAARVRSVMRAGSILASEILSELLAGVLKPRPTQFGGIAGVPTVGFEDGIDGALQTVCRGQFRPPGVDGRQNPVFRPPGVDGRQNPVFGQEGRPGMSLVARVFGPVNALVADPPCAALPPHRVSLHPFAAPAADNESPKGVGRGL
jgi:hypothetical protein